MRRSKAFKELYIEYQRTCPRCKGEGFYWCGGWNYKNEGPRDTKCETCRGVGMMTVRRLKSTLTKPRQGVTR